MGVLKRSHFWYNRFEHKTVSHVLIIQEYHKHEFQQMELTKLKKDGSLYQGRTQAGLSLPEGLPVSCFFPVWSSVQRAGFGAFRGLIATAPDISSLSVAPSE